MTQAERDAEELALYRRWMACSTAVLYHAKAENIPNSEMAVVLTCVKDVTCIDLKEIGVETVSADKYEMIRVMERVAVMMQGLA